MRSVSGSTQMANCHPLPCDTALGAGPSKIRGRFVQSDITEVGPGRLLFLAARCGLVGSMQDMIELRKGHFQKPLVECSDVKHCLAQALYEAVDKGQAEIFKLLIEGEKLISNDVFGRAVTQAIEKR